jgi:hypothetical protein
MLLELNFNVKFCAEKNGIKMWGISELLCYELLWLVGD